MKFREGNWGEKRAIYSTEWRREKRVKCPLFAAQFDGRERDRSPEKDLLISLCAFLSAHMIESVFVQGKLIRYVWLFMRQYANREGRVFRLQREEIPSLCRKNKCTAHEGLDEEET